jgi:TonB family protein
MKLRRTVHLLGSFALMTALLGGAHAEQAAPVAGPPGAASHAIQAAPMPLTEHEALPPSGKGNLFSDAQVRYCLAQLIRVDAIRPLLNRYEREEVEQFNALVADFNARCGSYRYKDNALDEAKAWLEDNRAQIERAARENYMTRFPSEPKVANAPKKPAAAASTTRASGEDKPAQPVAPTPPEAKTAAAAKPPTDSAKPAQTPASRPAVGDKQAHTVPKSAADVTASEPAGANPAPDASKPQPRPGRDDQPAAPTKPPAQSAKPKDIASTAADAAMKPGGARPAPGTAAEVSTTAAPVAEAIRAEPLISKPKEFPSESVTPQRATAPQSTPAPPEDKAAKSLDKPATAAPATTEPAKKVQPDERETATRPGARKSAKPATKPPPLPASTARKTEPPPAQVAAVAPKPEPPPTPEAALARLTQEIQRAGSQVLPQPAGASESGTDLTTQVEVRYASGGWVRSIVVGESSGSTALDEQALALARATRFPDVPESLRSRELWVRFPVIFRAAR